jgi:hypothetical protein
MAASACLPLGWGRSYFLPPKGGRHGAGESTSRDGAILTEAAATALAWRTLEIVEAPPLEAANAEVHIRRVEEFKALFALVKRIDASHFALRYVEMCDRLARLKKSQKPAG